MAARTLEDLRDEIRELRRARGPSAHLSASIREAAIGLAAQHGPEAYTEVGITLQSVKRWERLYPASFTTANKVTTATARALEKPKREKIGFVEIKTTSEPRLGRSLWPENAASVVEVARPDGWTIRMTGELARDFVSATIGKFSL